MAYFAKNKDNTEVCFNNLGGSSFPRRDTIQGRWYVMAKRADEYLCNYGVVLPKGSIKQLTGQDVDWLEDPINWEGGIV